MEIGLSYSSKYAGELGLDSKEFYKKMLTDLKPEYIRISAYWDEIEKKEGEFDFSLLDYEMDEALKAGTKVTLTIGQKNPRWPECHLPDWSLSLSEEEYKKKVLSYVEATVKRYKDHKALELWQLENEAFIPFDFGECKHFDGDLVLEELNLLRELDPNHEVLMTDSGEMGFWRKSAKNADVFGTTLYRIVRTPRGWVWSYSWLPANFYRWKAALTGVKKEKFMISELQAEPWFGEADFDDVSVEEMEETMDIERLKKHIEFARKTGASRAYLWGVEWWGYMKEKREDSRYWDGIMNQAP